MKLAISAFAVVLASSAAFAQGTGTPSSPSTSASPGTATQCWDMATNTVKNTQGKNLSASEGGSAASPSGTTGSAAPSGSASSGSSSGMGATGAAPTTRPAGMPTC